MPLITKKEIAELSDVNQENCISIFIPTHRAGKKVLQGEDTLVLKNQLKEVNNKLTNKGFSAGDIKKIMAPVQQLIDDTSFWREQSDGLAIFIAEGFSKVYTLPVHFQEYNYVSNSFYLKPLMPMFVGDGNFYLLMLERSNVKLYECTHHSFTEIKIDDCIPETKQDVVGYDYEQKNLQFRTGQAGHGAMYHGQEAATGKQRNEIKRYLRAINDGLSPLLKKDTIPMLIAAQDPQFDIYKEVNTYPNVMEENLMVNFGDTDIYEIHELAWEKMASVFDQKRKDKIALFADEQGTGKTAIGIDEIIPAAINGKVDALFCENISDIFGNYKEENGTITVTQREEDDNTISLMNVAAVKTFLNGGEVYLLDKEEMPNSNSRINALYRF
ncbi:MAG: hypothetical protein KA954_08405 [Chitinophagales bacterium]|nr:hypothetical protein [Bacteroidota bacterium]MBP7399594.1 hypothetical protein [Chitinophagales bacterium]MBK8680514.1 hypothetical protein [Bacteroidota bacterium]MBP8754972.1 hypothetical protein [Chitinophagales bacterium]MBP9188977.1 hypothetical protein [Chitinophagales bacterium]